jgi:methionyl aminopeptidase
MRRLLTYNELVDMRKAGKVAAHILKKMRKIIRPGISTLDIDKFFIESLKNYPGMKAAFKGYMGYPGNLCVSINDEVIHGIPSEKRLILDGDLVSVDLGIEYKGLFVDTAYTYPAGKCSRKARDLTAITLRSLFFGIKQAKLGNHTGDIGDAVELYAKKRGCSVIRQFVGHGVGEALHLYPEVPNFGDKGTGAELTANMVIAIEPMVSAGSWEVKILDDNWTVKTKDNSLSAHFEHTVAITKKGPWILTR